MIRRDQPLPVVLTRDEVRQLLAAVRETRFRAVFFSITFPITLANPGMKSSLMTRHAGKFRVDHNSSFRRFV
jgi:hypothetical protein